MKQYSIQFTKLILLNLVIFFGLAGCTASQTTSTTPIQLNANTNTDKIENVNQTNAVTNEKVNTNDTEVDTSDWETYKNEQIGLSLEYFYTWKIDQAQINDRTTTRFIQPSYISVDNTESPAVPLTVYWLPVDSEEASTFYVDCDDYELNDTAEKLLECSEKNINGYTFIYKHLENPIFTGGELILLSYKDEKNILGITLATAGIDNTTNTTEQKQMIEKIMNSIQLTR